MNFQINMMSFTLQVIVFGILVNGSLGCFLGGSPCGLLLNREVFISGSDIIALKYKVFVIHS